jgi:hypothetical protein
MPEWFWLALGVLGLGLLRLLLEFAGDMISQTVLSATGYGIGWCFLRLITFGRYPPKGREHNVDRVMITGFVVLAAIVAIVYFIFKSFTSPSA